MQKYIVLNNTKMSYTLRTSKRAKRIRLTVHSDGVIVATKPRTATNAVIESFIRQHANWLQAKLDFYQQFHHNPLIRHSRDDFDRYKTKAYKLVTERLRTLNQTYNFPYKAIRIKNQRTRWGSCSSKGNLNFNYKILFLPPRLRDYIIVHELCHLKEFNHSKKFWDLVSLTCPDHPKLRQELKINSPTVDNLV